MLSPVSTDKPYKIGLAVQAPTFALLRDARQARLAARASLLADDRASFVRRARLLLSLARLANAPALPR